MTSNQAIRNVGIAVALFVLCVIVVNVSTHHDEPRDPIAAYTAAPPTDAPAPRPDRRAQRVIVNAWYMKIIDAVAIARAGALMAGESEASGNALDASLMLKKAGAAAEIAVNNATNGPDDVDGWGDIAMKFFQSTGEYKDAINDLRNGLDDGKPSTFADAKEKLGDAGDGFTEAVHESRVKYQSMGGSSSDLPDGSDQEQVAEFALRAQAANGK